MNQYKNSWMGRAIHASKLIDENSVVLDLGAGEEILRDLIYSPAQYIPIDKDKLTENTIVLNLNELPLKELKIKINKDKVDYVVCLGLLEFIKDKQTFVEDIKNISDKLILSYFFEKNLIPNVEENSFFNKKEELENLLIEKGWKINDTIQIKNENHFLYFCTKEKTIKNRKAIGYWFSGKNNFGDELTWFIFKKLFKIELVYNKDTTKNCVLGCGSILGGKHLQDMLIWGSGYIADEKPYLQGLPKKIFAVRGELSRQKLKQRGIDCPQLYCDPAFILPDIFQQPEKIIYKVSAIPHYVDKKSFFIEKCKQRDIHIIDIQAPIEQVVKEVKQSEIILSSSLHGVIIADAFGKRSLPIEISPYVIGGDFKYLDYGTSVNNLRTKKNVSCYTISQLISYADSKSQINLIDDAKESLKSIGNYLEEQGLIYE